MTHTITHFTPTPENKVAEDIYKTPIQGLWYIPHHTHKDDRGFYAELNRIPEVEAQLGKSFVVKQTNLSFSNQNVIRGFHAENWDKLLSIITGTCFCAWTDIRPDSETFGQVVTMSVGTDEAALFGSIFVSSGIANSFCVTHGPANYLYAVNSLYAERDKSGDRALSLFDPELNVQWPIPREQMIVSERDLNAATFAELFPETNV